MKAVEIQIMEGGWPPMLVEGMFRPRGNGWQLEAWRSFDVSGGERFPNRWTLSPGQEAECERRLKAACYA